MRETIPFVSSLFKDTNGTNKSKRLRVFSKALAMQNSFYVIQQVNYTQNKTEVKESSSESRWNP